MFINWVHNSKYNLKVRSDQKILLQHKWISIDERLDIIDNLTHQIEKLVIH
jgi:hypothetical protein